MEPRLIEKFLSFEKNNGLFDGGNYEYVLWHIVRFRIYSSLFQKIERTTEAHPKRGINQKVFGILKSVILITRYPFFLRQKDVIIFSHPRRILNDEGYYECKYTEHLSGSNSYVFESPFQEKHFRPSQSQNLYYLDIILNIARLVSFFAPLIGILSKNSEELDHLEDLIIKEFGCSIPNFRRTIIQALAKHRTISVFAKIILRRIKPRKVIMTVSYSDVHLPFVEQCRKLGINVIEVQHGIMGPEHVAYNFLDYRKFNWFPNEVWVWNEFWAENTRLPLRKDCIKVRPLKFLEKYKKRFFREEGPIRQIIVISQGPFSKGLVDLGLELSKRIDRSRYCLSFKPHPSEMETVNFERLEENNIRILRGNNIYADFAEADYLIGVNSTALFEGLEFGLKVFVDKKYGYHLFEGMKGVCFFENESDIFENL
ncbi:hypothetical protein N9Y63_02295 [Akkermansiaceae bacterium]|nr:hypothetical protein [Akkermansiaceae bacterium]